MLSRIAEAMFWIGRYVERADDQARILDVHHHVLLEDPWVDHEVASAALLEVMGVHPALGEAPGPARTHAGPTPLVIGPHLVDELLAFDTESTSAIAGAIWAARENARGVRDTISGEMWESLNATWYLSRDELSDTDGAMPSRLFRLVKERAALFWGLADTTMSRDEAWAFLTLGRSLERVDMTCRLLSSRWAGATGSAGWVTTLRCCSAYGAYLRSYRRSVDVRRATEFLLLDRSFPRSVQHALGTAEITLAAIESSGASAPEARRLLGRAGADLRFREVNEILPQLPEVLRRLQDACAGTSDALATTLFSGARVVGWTA